MHTYCILNDLLIVISIHLILIDFTVFSVCTVFL